MGAIEHESTTVSEESQLKSSSAFLHPDIGSDVLEGGGATVQTITTNNEVT